MKDFSQADKEGLKPPTSSHIPAVLLRVLEQACLDVTNLRCVARANSAAGL